MNACRCQTHTKSTVATATMDGKTVDARRYNRLLSHTADATSATNKPIRAMGIVSEPYRSPMIKVPGKANIATSEGTMVEIATCCNPMGRITG